ncbi:leucine aminopeptidase 2, chloroplastic-like [Ananas comosus]|uniref:Leucine aminopeptidase 2, chloroplastic-like n=1 Tax=Ananas comosus TaxID=4615 RepID=A0A6P5GP55_ANACO|nr:leucine aminopeptidase 2, chloroplastic-like [Ananas comosus]
MGHSAAAAAATLGLTKPATIEPPQITFSAKDIDFAQWKGDVLAVAVSEKDMSKDSDSNFENPILKKLNKQLNGLLSEASSEEDFTGKAGQTSVLRLPGLGFKRLGLVGLGQNSPSNTSAYRGIGEAVAAVAKIAQAGSAAILLASSNAIPEESKPNALLAIASGILCYISCDVLMYRACLAQLGLLEKFYNLERVVIGRKKSVVVDLRILCLPILLLPSVYDVVVGSYLGRNRGTEKIKNPCLTDVTLNITAARLVYLPSTPLIDFSPKSLFNYLLLLVQVNNTDAEGRLTLADALVYTCKQGVEKVVDLATLTGACIVALGPSIAGFFTPSDDLAKEIGSASEITGEKFWRLPLEESYWESMKSGVADMVNTGGRQGGAITAALFLKQFVDEKVQWMHIDMAGPVWNDKKRAATGFGVSTLVEWVLKNSS